MFEPHQTPKTPAQIMAQADPTVEFPCVMRLHREDPCKGWLLEIHAAWLIEMDHPLEEDDAACRAAFEQVARFVEIGNAALPAPGGADLRVRQMGNSGEWAMFEFTSLHGAELEAAIGRFSTAYGHAPIR